MIRAASVAHLLLSAAVWGEPPAAAQTVELAWTQGRPDRKTAHAFTPGDAAAQPQGAIMPIGNKTGRVALLPIGPFKEVLLATSVKGAPPVIWVDGQGDRDLSNDYGRRLDERAYTLSLPVLLPGAARASDIDVRFSFAAPDAWHWLPLIHRRGHVVLAGRRRVIALLDGDGDLQFKAGQGATDRVCLDINGDGELDLRAGTYEVFPLDIACPLGVRVLANADGSEVRLIPAPAPPTRTAPWAPVAEEKRSYWGKPTKYGKVKTEFRKYRRSKRGEKYPHIWVQRPLSSMGQLRTKAAGRFLWSVAQNDSNARIRALAVQALGEPEYQKYEAGITKLARGEINTRKLNSNGPMEAYKIQSAAIVALHHMKAASRSQTYRDLLSGKAPARLSIDSDQLYNCAALSDDPEVRAALGKLLDEVLQTKHRSDADDIYAALRFCPERPHPRWSRAVALHRYARDTAATALGDLWWVDPVAARATALTIAQGKLKSVALRAAAARVLAIAGDKEAIPVALALAPAAIDLAPLLAPVRNDEAIAALIEAISQHEAAVRALAQIRSADVADALIGALQQGPTVALVQAVGNQRDPRCLAALVRAAQAKDDAVRVAALKALPKHGPVAGAHLAWLQRLLKSSAVVERVLALFFAEHPDVVTTVTPSLRHKEWTVRLAAVHALAKGRSNSAVAPLITALAQDKEHWRIRRAAAHALRAVTGERHGMDAAAWQAWWTENKATFRIPPPPAAAKKGQPKSTFFGIPLNSDRVIFVIDRSGSMANAENGKRTRMDIATTQLLRAAKSLPGNPRINVILFANKATAWQERLSPIDEREVRAFLKKHPPQGATALYDGLELAMQDNEADTIVILTDGNVTAGTIKTPAAIKAATQMHNPTGLIQIHTIAIGQPSPLLADLAAAHAGRYVER